MYVQKFLTVEESTFSNTQTEKFFIKIVQNLAKIITKKSKRLFFMTHPVYLIIYWWCLLNYKIIQINAEHKYFSVVNCSKYTQQYMRIHDTIVSLMS